MKCPFCNCEDTKVVDKRNSEESIRRRRECLKCANRFTTYERIESSPIKVVKKDGTKEYYSREKLIKGLIRACEKRNIEPDVLEKLAEDIQSHLRKTGETEFSTKEIGKQVMKRLKKLDRVAYIRFASVYRDFQEIDDFNRELEKLSKK